MNEEHSAGEYPAGWTAVIIMMVAVVIGAVAIIFANWPLFWIGGVGVVILGAIVGKVMGMMGYGATKHEVSADH